MNKKILYRTSFGLILILALFLRLYKLDKLLPPYWEEVALGFDAFSISETLRDHHGNFLPLVAFESFGDWKPALYFYTIVPFIKILGLNVMAVRLPSLFAGLSIVLGIGVLIKQLLFKHPNNSQFKLKNLSLLAMFLTAISPWAILFSRAGWEVNLATALILWGVIIFFKFLQLEKKPLKFLLLSSLLLLLSMYAYHATRLIAPLLGLALMTIWFLENQPYPNVFKNLLDFISKNSSRLILTLCFSLIIAFPLLKNLSNPTTSQRFNETSIFSNLEIIQESNARKLAQPGLMGKLFYHRYLLFSREVMTNYLSHFEISFLFLTGDTNPRHSIQFIGQLYHLEIIFLLVGFFFILKTVQEKTSDPQTKLQKKFLGLLLFWLFIGIIPASITHAAPHALRILPAMPVFIVLITLGIRQLFLWFNNLNFSSITNLKNKITTFKKINVSSLTIFWVIIFALYFAEFLMFARFYTKIYPQQYSNQWQAGYQNLIANLELYNKNKKQIYLSRTLGRPLMYYWFYNRTSPKLVQKWDSLAAQDQGEYLEFENLKTFDNLDEIEITPAVIVLSPLQFEQLEKAGKFQIQILKEIVDLAQEIVLIIVEIK